MGNTIQVEKANERCQMLYELLKEDPGKKFKAKDILNLFSISYKTFYKDVDRLKREYPGSIERDRGVIFYVPAKKEEKIVAASTRYPDYKNDEGYMDLTASKAINNVEPKKPVKTINTVADPAPGQVWDVKSSNGSVEKYIVLAVDYIEDFCICTPYVKTEDAYMGWCHKIYYKPVRYFVERTWNIPLSELTNIRNELSSFLCIDPVEKIVEVKVPEKVVETATNPNAIYTEADMEMALTKQKAEIYEQCFKMMCGR